MKRFIAGLLVAIIVSAELIVPVQAMEFDRQFYSGNDILFYDPRCIDDTSNGELLALSGEGNIELILNFFMQKGLNLAQASGIVGNMAQESGTGVDPKTGVKIPTPNIRQGGRIVDDTYQLENGVGYGLVQWTWTSRQKPLQDHMASLGVGITNLNGQLEFVWKELNEGYSHTLQALRAANDPVEAAVVVHGPPSPGYEASADTPAEVRSVRGGNAQKVYDTYVDAPALAGSTADASMVSTHNEGPEKKKKQSSSCDGKSFQGGDLAETTLAYAWETHKGNDITAKDAYQQAVARAQGAGLYVGGIKYKGIDCGGFVTLLLRDSKFETGYNYEGKGGNTIHQEKWMRENWEQISSTDAGDREPGDVAINDTHTYIYVGDIDGFDSQIASASLDERAPMAGQEGITDPSFRWYRQKSGANKDV